MNNNISKLLIVTVSAVFSAGCATVGNNENISKNDVSTSGVVNQNASLLQEKDQQIARLMQQLEASRNECAATTTAECASSGNTSSSLYPPDPKPGECYARVIVPAQYNTSSDQILLSEAGERIEIIPAVYGPGEESVLVKEASTRLKVIPPVYETVSDRVMIKPAGKKVVEVPAVYETLTEKVLDSPARTEWKRGTGIGSGKGTGFGGAAAQVTRFEGKKVLETRVVEDTGDLMCLVEVPATYKTIKKKKLVSPPTTRVEEIPAQYKTITKRVLKTPATTKEVSIPAEYKTIRTTQLITPAAERRVPVPAEYTTVTKKTKVSEEQIVWRPVLCEVNMTVKNVSALQSEIGNKEPGCWQCGRFDGIMGRCTLRAAQCYARKHGIASGDKYVTLDLIRHLGLTF